MTTTTERLAQPTRSPYADANRPADGGSRRAAGWLPVIGIAVLAALLRLPFLTAPLTSDEGGFLMMAGQWRPGTSLYGDYWVDRPPLLITLLQPIATMTDPAVGLRLLGVLAVVVSVLCAGRLGYLLAPSPTPVSGVTFSTRWLTPAVLCAATVAVFADSPLFGGANEVDGELLSLPFVLASLVASVSAVRTHDRRTRLRLWTASGAAALAAVAVKQSMLDGFVAAGTLVVWLALQSRRSHAREAVLGFAAGASVSLLALLTWAGLHGTTPGPLWDAVFTFRAQAGAVISAGAPPTNDARARLLLSSFLASGAMIVLASALVPRRRPVAGIPAARRRSDVPDPRILLAPVLAWEVAAVALGGSYWLHYLIGLIPALVLAVATVAAHRPRRLPVAVIGLTWALTVGVVVGAVLLSHPAGSASEIAVERYLLDHEQPGDTGVVAFGDPALLEATGLASPYPELWSLPVRVRDPRLTAFTAVLDSPRRPTWLLVDGSSLATWGVDSQSAQIVADRSYVLRTVIGDWHVYHVETRRSEIRSQP